MTEKTVKILGKDVRVRYCAAAENGFEEISTKSIYEIDFHSQKDRIALAIACILAAYERTKEEPPVTADNLLYDANSQDIIDIVTAIVELRNSWYTAPKVVEKLAEKESSNEVDKEPKND